MLFVVLLVGLLVLARVGRAVADRARARTAADAAALAGVRDGADAARDLARANGGRLLHFVEASGEVEVTVQVGDRQASARARLDIEAQPADDERSQ
jgi:Flp pilus assembly protein TadG